MNIFTNIQLGDYEQRIYKINATGNLELIGQSSYLDLPQTLVELCHINDIDKITLTGTPINFVKDVADKVRDFGENNIKIEVL